MKHWQFGKPVVASKIGGIPELIENDKTGYLYEYNNVQELKDTLNKMFNTDKYQELSDNAKEYAKKYFSKEEYYNRLIKIYEEVANKNE